MINLSQRTLPDSVTVDGRVFFINTDYRIWLRFESDMKKGKSFDCTYIFKDELPESVVIPIQNLLEFAHPKSELPRPTRSSDSILIDYEIDADYIYAAFMQCYGINLLQAEMHWWEFLALLKGLSEDCVLSKIISYRSYRKSNGKKDPYEELKHAWEIYPPITEEEQAELDEFDSLFT